MERICTSVKVPVFCIRKLHHEKVIDVLAQPLWAVILVAELDALNVIRSIGLLATVFEVLSTLAEGLELILGEIVVCERDDVNDGHFGAIWPVLVGARLLD